MKVRINKFLSKELSRRQADLAIQEGRVKINNQIALPGQMVDFTDLITLDNQIIPGNKVEEKVWIYHKPPGYLVSNQRHNQMPTIFEIMPKVEERMIYCGRLDFLSEGLLLLTNSPALAHDLTNNNYERVYWIYTKDQLKQQAIKEISQGIAIEGWHYQPIKIQKIPLGYELILTEGKNREIRNIFKYFGLRIDKLIRVKYHNFSLGNLGYNQIILAKFINNQDKVNYF